MFDGDEGRVGDHVAYRKVRQACAILLIVVVGLIVVADVAVEAYAVDPLVLAPLLLAAAGLLAVDIPGMGTRR